MVRCGESTGKQNQGRLTRPRRAAYLIGAMGA
jgi:hypothetical protein